MLVNARKGGFLHGKKKEVVKEMGQGRCASQSETQGIFKKDCPEKTLNSVTY